jgi:amidase
MLDLLRTPMPGDPYMAPPVARPYVDELGQPTGRLRIGLLLGPGRQDAPPPDPEVVEGVRKAGRLLEQLGHDVSEAAPAAFVDEGYARHFLTVVVADVALTVRQLERQLGRTIADDELEPRNGSYRRWGEALSAPDYLAARAWLGQWSRRMASWWAAPEQGGQGFDLLVSPVIARVPPEIGWYRAAGPEQEDDRIAEVLQYTGQLNATGQPAVSLPLHESAGGVPIGVQFVAAYAREDLLVRLAGQLEQVQPWAHRRPQVWAD